MLSPRPGIEAPLKVVELVVKNISARLSCWPNLAAHQARETPHPSHVPQFEVDTMVVVTWAVIGVRRVRRGKIVPLTGNW